MTCWRYPSHCQVLEASQTEGLLFHEKKWKDFMEPCLQPKTALSKEFLGLHASNPIVV